MASTTTVVAPTQAGVNNKLTSGKEVKPQQHSRPRRPNYKHLHRFPLPLHVYPLPPLIPHNPLSVISIALSYLTYFISPPQHEVYSAYFDALTSSVHVTDPKAIRALWEMGFFGKGSLSRSEPSWLEREKKRRGLLGVSTSEEATRQRRIERRDWKLERARKEREAIAEQLKVEAEAGKSETTQAVNGDGVVPAMDNKNVSELDDSETAPLNGTTRTEGLSTPSSLPLSEPSTANAEVENHVSEGHKTVRFSPIVEKKEYSNEHGFISTLPDPAIPLEDDAKPLTDQEHLQLSNEEAFFLAYGLGALQIYDPNDSSIIPTSSLLLLFRRHSFFPPREPTIRGGPDDTFLISYVVYHHFRSLGWIVRSGVKFGVDYLLYNRGPVFSHAEFAVTVLPSYGHPYWSATEQRKQYVAEKESRTWWWLHCVNRVQAQVKKSLIVVYVEIPPPSHATTQAVGVGENDVDIGALLKRYIVREMSIRRWVPNRSRD
ncbi:tRNA-intron endonuclease [Polytolypa hystricis UAMH7299]|uniref:tRNA-splicing endonuclease subunit Sen2 n=1 Tax=Polytolypa hystricis (strain UAMH7299) TaxID=1447883 RepID=A0A2B7XKF0_POLH7|nr:tRNA-intron endonuclease [Polytolypa hystricis UAMH7299]